VTQALHILAVTVFVGAIVIGDLRLLGWGPVGESRASIARSAQRVLLWAGLAVLVTGIPQFTTNALTYHRSWLSSSRCTCSRGDPLHRDVRQRVAVADEGRLESWVPKVVGAVSLRALDGVTIQRTPHHLLRLIARQPSVLRRLGVLQRHRVAHGVSAEHPRFRPEP
jgi:hypothetical protein